MARTGLRRDASGSASPWPTDRGSHTDDLLPPLKKPFPCRFESRSIIARSTVTTATSSLVRTWCGCGRRPIAGRRSAAIRCAISPGEHFLNWQQDPYGNYLARLVFNKDAPELKIEVDLNAEMTVINPFDFFLEAEAEYYPFAYAPTLLKDLMPFLHVSSVTDDSPFAKFLRTVDRRPRKTIDFLVELNQQLKNEIGYVIRLEPGVQTCDETLSKRTGSCRDTGWVLVNLLRHLGFAARFVSGYLIQLTADVKSLDGPSGPEKDFTDLHAWAEVFLPGAGWIGLDPTSGLLVRRGAYSARLHAGAD